MIFFKSCLYWSNYSYPGEKQLLHSSDLHSINRNQSPPPVRLVKNHELYLGWGLAATKDIRRGAEVKGAQALLLPMVKIQVGIWG